MFRPNLSGNVTSYLYMRKKSYEEKDEAAAAANLSDSAEENLSGFFEILARALADSGYPGIRAAQFTDLTGFLQDYANLTGSPPDQRTADYIVGRVIETTGIRNIAAFVRRLAHDVLTTGEGYVAQETAQATATRAPYGALAAARLVGTSPGARRTGFAGAGCVGCGAECASRPGVEASV